MKSAQRQQREGDHQQRHRRARDQERMHVAAEGKLADSRRDLRRAEQRADQHHGRRIDAGAAEDREQMRGQRGRHEGIGGEGRGDQHEGNAVRRQHAAGATPVPSGGAPVTARLRGSANACSGAQSSASSAA